MEKGAKGTPAALREGFKGTFCFSVRSSWLPVARLLTALTSRTGISGPSIVACVPLSTQGRLCVLDSQDSCFLVSTSPYGFADIFRMRLARYSLISVCRGTGWETFVTGL